MTHRSNPGIILRHGLHGDTMTADRPREGHGHGAFPPFHAPSMLVATVLGVGRIPFASGTFGSLAALPLGWAIGNWGGPAALVAAAVATCIVGALAASRIVGRDGDADPGFIVVDEVAGQLLALAFAPQEWWAWAIAFAAFRATDILKPFPAGWCDRNIGGGIGVMADDMVAGVQAGVATWALCSFTSIGGMLRALGG